MAQSSAWTFGEAVASRLAGTSRFSRAERRRQLAEVLASLDVIGSPNQWLDSALPISATVAAKLETAVARLESGEPLAYVTGRIGFRHLELHADARALIPRPETEGLVDRVLARTSPGGVVVDVGTGTGCIALALATEGVGLTIMATDLQAAALELAADNAARLGVSVPFFRGDLTAGLRSGSIDTLVSNPPYLSEDEFAALDGSVRFFEPASALQAGPDGMAHIRGLLDDGRRVVRAGGWLAAEIDAARSEAVAHMATTLGWQQVTVQQDLFGRERYLLAQRSAD